MHVSLLTLETEKAPTNGRALYVVADEHDKQIVLVHPVTLDTLNISIRDFRAAHEVEIWPMPHAEAVKHNWNAPTDGVTFPEKIARMIERATAIPGKQYSDMLIRRILASLRGLPLEKVAPTKQRKESDGPAAPRGFARQNEGRPGVIDAIKLCLERDNGASIEEMIETLTELFPDRSPDGMKTTVRCQLHRLPAKVGRSIASDFDNDRGKVFRWAPQ